MKTEIKIAFIVLFSIVFQAKLAAQVCAKKLPVPDKTFLKNVRNSDDAAIEYFEKYFGRISKSKVLKNFAGNKKSCKTIDTFKNGIVYEKNKCSELEIEVLVFFPGYCKTELVKYVEWFFKTEWNAWNEEKTLYQPKENGNAGCYIEIKQNKKGFYIKSFCGE